MNTYLLVAVVPVRYYYEVQADTEAEAIQKVGNDEVEGVIDKDPYFNGSELTVVQINGVEVNA